MPAPIKELKKFYQSKLWRNARKEFLIKQRGICNKCGEAGWEVHHKIPLTLANFKDPEISLNPNNFELLCTSCHNAERYENIYIRDDLSFDSEGNIIKKQ